MCFEAGIPVWYTNVVLISLSGCCSETTPHRASPAAGLFQPCYPGCSDATPDPNPAHRADVSTLFWCLSETPVPQPTMTTAGFNPCYSGWPLKLLGHGPRQYRCRFILLFWMFSETPSFSKFTHFIQFQSLLFWMFLWNEQPKPHGEIQEVFQLVILDVLWNCFSFSCNHHQN